MGSGGVYQTERLRLVPIGTRHAPELWELHQGEGIARWYSMSRDEAVRFADRMERGWRDRRLGKWLAYEESTGALVGRGGRPGRSSRAPSAWRLAGRFGGRCGGVGTRPR